jgi:PAS domain S-box-containing protein
LAQGRHFLRRQGTALAAFAAFYAAVALLGLTVSISEGNVSLLWPASGVAVGVLTRRGVGLAPGVFLGAALANALTGVPLSWASMVGAGNMLEAIAGAWVLRRLVGVVPGWLTPRGILALVSVGAFGPSLIAASIGSSALCLSGQTGWPEFWTVWRVWWLGDSAGIIIVTPLVLSVRLPRGRADARRIAGFLPPLAAATAAAAVGFFPDITESWPHLAIFLPVPFVLWLGLEHGVVATSLSCVAVTVTAAIATAAGFGPFVAPGAAPDLHEFVVYSALLTAGGLLVATTAAERSRVAATLAEREQQFGDFARSTADWFWELDDRFRFVMDTGQLPRAGHEGKDVLGHTRWDMPGADPNDPIWTQHKADLEAHRPIRDFVFPYKGAQGRLRHVRISGNPIFAPDGTFRGYRGTARDITDQVEAEAERRKAVERLEITLDAAEVGTFDWNVQSGHAVFDHYWAGMLGYRVDELAPHVDAWRRLVHPEDMPEVSRRLEAHLRGETPFQEVEFRMRAKSGDWRWILARAKVVERDAEGKPLRMTGTHIDVTKRRQAEIALADSERRYRSMINALGEGIVFQQQDGKIIANNRRAEEILGLTAAQIAGRDSLDPRWRAVREDGTPFPGDEHPTMVTLRTGKPCRSVVMGVHRPDGSLRWISINSEPLFGDGGEVSAAVCSFADITERREAEERLFQAQKMDALGQLTGGIAHDFNNLLAIILGNLDLIEHHLANLRDAPDAVRMRELACDERLERYLKQALYAAGRGAELIQHLLSFGRRQTLRPEVTDLNRLLIETEAMLRHALGETIVVQTVLPADLGKTRIDQAQLETALLNLAINARDSMAAGGRLTIEASNVEIERGEAEREAGKIRPGPYVLLAVSDTGSGMPPDVLAHAFEPFFTTKEVGKGTGLGLAMVYGFVNQSGGFARIRSREGEGTTVQLYLPRVDSEVRTPEPVQAPVKLTGEPRMLLVEDELALRSLVTTLLEEMGCVVLTAESGPRALELLRNEGPFDLLLTDLVLPGGLSGVDVAKKAKALCPGLRILFMSGYPEGAVGSNQILRPGDNLLRKPFRKGDLVEYVLRTLGSRGERSELQE